MVIEKRIRINDKEYHLGIKLKYDKAKTLTKFDGSFFDMGDLSRMIDYVETNYEKESKKFIYDNDVSYMNDVIYLYDRFPFLNYIKDITYDNERKIVMLGYIGREEIVDYIRNNKIRINRWDKEKCICPLLYK